MASSPARSTAAPTSTSTSTSATAPGTATPSITSRTAPRPLPKPAPVSGYRYVDRTRSQGQELVNYIAGYPEAFSGARVYTVQLHGQDAAALEIIGLAPGALSTMGESDQGLINTFVEGVNPDSDKTIERIAGTRVVSVDGRAGSDLRAYAWYDSTAVTLLLTPGSGDGVKKFLTQYLPAQRRQR